MGDEEDSIVPLPNEDPELQEMMDERGVSTRLLQDPGQTRTLFWMVLYDHSIMIERIPVEPDSRNEIASWDEHTLYQIMEWLNSNFILTEVIRVRSDADMP